MPSVLGVGFVGVSIISENTGEAFSDLFVHKYMKIQKMVVKQTGNRCRGLFLKLKPISRYETTLDVGCEELVRPVTGGFVSEHWA